MPSGVYERRNSVRQGERYGDWTVVRQIPERSPNGDIQWMCRCACGTEKAVAARGLRSKSSTSCGCRRVTNHLRAITKHGMADSPVYAVWRSMRQRCKNPNAQMWDRYGGRGISVDPRWDDFAMFAADMGPRPQGHSLDRIDNDGNYTPGNCRWAPGIEQARNTSRNRTLTFAGETLTVTEWALRTGIHKATIAARLRKGATPEQALRQPVYTKRKR